MYDDRGNMLESRDVIVKPEGFTIPPEASRVHGITTLVAREKGEPLQEVMEQFARKIDEATALVGHNISFDECIVGFANDDDPVPEAEILYDETFYRLL